MPDNYITSSTNTAAHFNNCLTFAKTAIQNNFSFVTSTLSFRFALPAENENRAWSLVKIDSPFIRRTLNVPNFLLKCMILCPPLAFSSV